MPNMHPAEVARGLLWEETFSSAASIVRNGGVVTGAPRFDSAKGMYFDGSTYIVYPMRSQIFNTAIWSCVIKFIPDFNYNDGIAHTVMDTDAPVNRIQKTVVNGTLLTNNGTNNINTTASADQIWRNGIPTTMVVVTASGYQRIYIDGVQIRSAAVAVSPLGPNDTLYLGVQNTTASKWNGWIRSIKFFRGNVTSDLLSLQEASDYANNSTFNYEGKASCILPLTMNTYDPTNARVKDVSGRGNHFSLGDGVTPATYPTKRPTRGMSFDGGDYLKRNSSSQFDFSASGLSATICATVGYSASTQGLIAKGVAHATSDFFLAALATTDTIYYRGLNAATSVSWVGARRNGIAVYTLTVLGGSTVAELYVNGKPATRSGATLAIGYTGDRPVTIGSVSAGALPLKAGTIVYYVAFRPFVLTPIQVWDNYQKLLGAINAA